MLATMPTERSTTLETRAFTPEDAEDVHRMIQALAKARGRFESNLVLRGDFSEHFPAYVNAVTKGGSGVVRIAEAGDGLAGVAIAVETKRDPWLPSEKAAEVRAIYVDPDHRRQGVAEALISDLETWARDRGLSVLSVHTFADHPEEAEAMEAIGFHPYRVQLEKDLS